MEKEILNSSSSTFAQRYPDRFLTSKEMTEIIGLSKPSLDRYEEKDPTFPRRIRLSHSRVVWRLREVLIWMDDKAAERGAA